MLSYSCWVGHWSYLERFLWCHGETFKPSYWQIMCILSSWNSISWCSLKTTLHPSDPFCHHLPSETVITQEKPLITLWTLQKKMFPDNSASQWKPGHVSFVSCQAAQGLGTFCCGGLWINAAPRILHLDQIRQNHAERPQPPLSRSPDVARIQALAVLNKQSVALGIRFGLSIEPTRWTLWQH